MKCINGKYFYLLLEELEPRLLLDSTVYPTDYDQYMLELINRARLDPGGEAALCQIDLNEGVPPEKTISPEPSQPLAFNLNLMDAAVQHSQWMLANDTFGHTGSDGSSPHSRMTASEYVFTPPWASGENLAWLGMWPNEPNETDGAAQLHENLFVDEDYPDRGHRVNMLHPYYQEVGIGLLPGLFNYENQDYNSVIVTIDFARTAGDSFLTGVVYDDKLNDDFYTPGEGKGGLTVTAIRESDRAEFTAQTFSTGGYALPLPAGTYQVYVSTSTAQRLLGGTVVMENSNVKTDFPLDILKAPEIWVGANSRTIKSGDTAPGIDDHTDFGDVDVDREMVANTYSIRNNGKGKLGITDVQISGSFASDFELLTPPSSSVNPGARTTFEVRFDPSEPGLRSATITIINNDGDENPYTFTVQGTGVYKPELTVSSVQYPSGAYSPGDSFTWEAAILNQGSGDIPAAAAFTVEAHLSTNRIWNDADDIILTPAYLHDTELTADQSRQIAQPVSVPADAVAGVYYLGVMIDSQAAIEEISETNNTWWSDTPDAGIQNQLTLDGGDKTIFFDVNGRRTIFSLTGPGSAEILVPPSADAFEMVLDDTTVNSKFRINNAGRFEKTVRSIMVNGSLKGIVSKKTDLIETIEINGSLSSLRLGDIYNNALISTAAGSKKGLAFKADQIGAGVTFAIADSIKSFKVNSSLQDVMISARDTIKKISAKGDIIDSFILAGYDMNRGGIEALGSGDIGAISVKGLFQASYISAGVLPPVPELQDVLPGVLPPYYGLGNTGNIGKVKFAAIDQNAAGAFGLWAATDIKAVKAGKTIFTQTNPQLHFHVEPNLG